MPHNPHPDNCMQGACPPAAGETPHSCRWTKGLVPVHPDETLEWLTPDGMAVIQKKEGFRFGTDALALAGFALSHLRRGNGKKPLASVLDLGTGSGILPLLLARDTLAAQVTGIEIQPEMANMASRSVIGNALSHRVRIVEGDLKSAGSLIGRGSQDLVLSNPPYQPIGAALRSGRAGVDAARHEVFCTLADVVAQASACLRPGGAFCLVHKPERLTELMLLLNREGLEPKQLQFLHPHAGKPPSLMLVRALRGGRRGLHVLPPLLREPQKGTTHGHCD